jgi:hypothetical protein
MAQIPTEDWFIYKQEALNYVNEIVREIHWLDPRLEKYHHMLPIKHVKTISPITGESRTQWGYGFWFHFEIDRGRPQKGHIYRIYPTENFVELQRCGDIHYKRGKTDPKCIYIECNIFNLTGEMLLDALREYVILEVLES